MNADDMNATDANMAMNAAEDANNAADAANAAANAATNNAM